MDLWVYMNLWGTELMYESRLTIRADHSMHTALRKENTLHTETAVAKCR